MMNYGWQQITKDFPLFRHIFQPPLEVQNDIKTQNKKGRVGMNFMRNLLKLVVNIFYFYTFYIKNKHSFDISFNLSNIVWSIKLYT